MQLVFWIPLCTLALTSTKVAAAESSRAQEGSLIGSSRTQEGSLIESSRAQNRNLGDSSGLLQMQDREESGGLLHVLQTREANSNMSGRVAVRSAHKLTRAVPEDEEDAKEECHAATPFPDVITGRLSRFAKRLINLRGKQRLVNLQIPRDNEAWQLFDDDDVDTDDYDQIFVDETDAEKMLDQMITEALETAGKEHLLLQLKEKYGLHHQWGFVSSAWNSASSWVSGAADTVADAATTVWDDIEAQAGTMSIVAGPVNIHMSKGVSVEPKFEVGVQGDNFALKAGFEDVRSGIHFGFDASVKIIFTTHGTTISELFKNIKSKGCQLYSDAASFHGWLVSKAMDLTGVDLSLGCYMEATITVVALGDANKMGVSLGWADKDGFHMLGGTFWFKGYNVGFYIGWHSNGKYMRFVIAINEVTVDIVIKGSQQPLQCQDEPGWYDSDGPQYNCNWYSRGANCAWYGHAYRNKGKTANEACCKCIKRLAR